jgi:hypothetical protein
MSAIALIATPCLLVPRTIWLLPVSRWLWVPAFAGTTRR